MGFSIQEFFYCHIYSLCNGLENGNFLGIQEGKNDSVMLKILDFSTFLTSQLFSVVLLLLIVTSCEEGHFRDNWGSELIHERARNINHRPTHGRRVRPLPLLFIEAVMFIPTTSRKHQATRSNRLTRSPGALPTVINILSF
jgi:hypothetical protein